MSWYEQARSITVPRRRGERQRNRRCARAAAGAADRYQRSGREHPASLGARLQRRVRGGCQVGRVDGHGDQARAPAGERRPVGLEAGVGRQHHSRDPRPRAGELPNHVGGGLTCFVADQPEVGRDRACQSDARIDRAQESQADQPAAARSTAPSQPRVAADQGASGIVVHEPAACTVTRRSDDPASAWIRGATRRPGTRRVAVAVPSAADAATTSTFLSTSRTSPDPAPEA